MWLHTKAPAIPIPDKFSTNKGGPSNQSSNCLKAVKHHLPCCFGRHRSRFFLKLALLTRCRISVLWPTDSISFDKCIMLRLRQALTKYMQIPLIFGTPIHFQHPNAGCNRLINSRPLRRILEIGAVQMASLLNDIPYFLHLSQETMVRNNGRTDGSAIHQIAVLTPAVRVSLDSSIRFVENTKTQSRIYN